MTDDEPQTVPDADPEAVLAIAAELARKQLTRVSERDARRAERRAMLRARFIANLGDIQAKAAIARNIRREDKARLKAERLAEREALRAEKRAEMQALRAKLRAIPRPDKKRRPALAVRLPDKWTPAELNTVIRAMLTLCSEDPRAYDLARSLQDAVIDATPDTMKPLTEAGMRKKGWTGPIVIGPRKPDPDPED